jgi:phosphoglycolate phosphatase
MSKQINLLVFDWDGTLMDSQYRIITSFQMAIAEVGFEERTPKQIGHIIGLGLQEAIASLFPLASAEEHLQLAARYRAYFLSNSHLPTPLFPGVVDTLHFLSEAGYWLAVATGKSRRGLNQALQETNLKNLFHSTRCAEETASKPNPQMLHEIMAELNQPATKTLMIGDSEYDLQMAHHAQVGAVAVASGVHEKSHLLTCCQPLVCLEHLSDLPNWLRTL